MKRPDAISEAQRIDKIRRDFIANVSHELRTPLTVINGFLEIACAQPDLDVSVRMSHLRLMLEQGRRMQNLIEDMLTLTRLEAIDSPSHVESVDMRSLLAQLLRDAKALSGARHTITLTSDNTPIDGNTSELHSAFGNLVANAVRYTPEGGRIHILWQRTESGACFSVQDSGIGIRAEHIARLTERFYRVDKGRLRDTQGTGLGLAIVKHVLLRHAAVLEIESQEGKGSTFTAKFTNQITNQITNQRVFSNYGMSLNG